MRCFWFASLIDRPVIGTANGELRVSALGKIVALGLSALSLSLALTGCGAPDDPASGAPPRATDAIVFPKEPSHLAVNLKVDLAALEQVLEREVPRELWTIDQPGSECISSSKIDLAVVKVKSPKIKCRIVGQVTRGTLRLSGSGEALRVSVPVTGTISARDVAGIFKGETATGEAEVTLAVRLDMTPDWRLASNARLDYSWTREPGIDFLGQRITFTSKADRELAPVKREVERIVRRELAALPVRDTALDGWKEAHAMFELNERNPQVWGRLMPQRFRFGGYNVRGRELTLRLGLDALMETFIGMKPQVAQTGPLPRLARRDAATRMSRLHVPVVADYAVLEPVVEKALAKRAARPFVIEDYGSVTAQFGDVAIYGTGKGQIAIGATFRAVSDLPLVEQGKGMVWLTARPVTQPNSRIVRLADVRINAATDIIGESVLVALANSPEFQGAIAEALTQNFEKDFMELRGKIDRALTARRDGPTSSSIAIEDVATGVITAHGAGLYMPVDMTARIDARLRRLN